MAPEKTASVHWQGAGNEFHAVLGTGYEFEMRAPASAQGGTPMEFLLAGVAGCTAIDVIGILQKQRQQVDDLEVQIRGIQAENPPNVYTHAEIVYIVHGKNIDPAAVEKAIQLSESKYCSASTMFKRSGTAITHTYRIESPVAA
jgi:putative redox protein